jgi:dienelactone hydrolase
VYLNRFICGTPQPSCHRLLARIERGYNVLTFDGPGQYGPIHRERMPFRTDWEPVVTPIVDFALSLPGVDPERIVLMGVSMGGVLAPRAAALRSASLHSWLMTASTTSEHPRSRPCLQINEKLSLRRSIRKKLPSLTACSKRA